MIFGSLFAVEENDCVGRVIQNAMGADEVLTLPNACWEYFDWCVDNGLDMAGWIKEIDSLRDPSTPLSDQAQSELWYLRCYRYFHEYDDHDSTPPPRYPEFLKYLEDNMTCPNANELIGRLLVNALGIKETVVMKTKHWKYFDFLSQHGDMHAWVVEADKYRHQTKNDLSTELMNSLRRHEKKLYLKGVEVPLYISPMGYFRDSPAKDKYPKS